MINWLLKPVEKDTIFFGQGLLDLQIVVIYLLLAIKSDEVEEVNFSDPFGVKLVATTAHLSLHSHWRTLIH